MTTRTKLTVMSSQVEAMRLALDTRAPFGCSGISGAYHPRTWNHGETKGAVTE